MTMELNPLSIEDTILANGEEALGDEAQDALDALLAAMAKLPADSRVNVFVVLGDFYCRHCGIDQPQGDCQCRV